MNNIHVREFRKVLRIFERELAVQNQSTCCCGVTIAQCHTLMELDIKDNITLNELAQRVNLDKSTVSRTVETLVNQELLDRTIPKNNRRTTLISLTDQGREVVKTINSGNDYYYRQVLMQIPEEIRGTFMEGFRILADNMVLLNKST